MFFELDDLSPLLMIILESPDYFLWKINEMLVGFETISHKGKNYTLVLM